MDLFDDAYPRVTVRTGRGDGARDRADVTALGRGVAANDDAVDAFETNGDAARRWIDAKRAFETYGRAVESARARAWRYDRGRRGGGSKMDAAPPCAFVEATSALAGLVPGERFEAPTESATWLWRRRSAARRTRELVAYARDGVEQGWGLEGTRETTTPEDAFRDGSLDDGDDGAVRRRSTGLVVFALDASNATGVTEEGHEPARGATFGCVGTLCQWIHRTPCFVEFRALNIVWCEFPDDFDTTKARENAFNSMHDMSLFPPVALDDVFAPSGINVYTLGVHKMRDNRVHDSRKLMGKILDYLSESKREFTDAVAWKEEALRQVVEESLPVGARHPSEFSFWCLHAIPSIALDTQFRWLVLSIDDAYSRLSLILSRLQLEAVMPPNHVPVTHRCGFVLTTTRMMRQFSNIDGFRTDSVELRDTVPTAVRSKIFFNPGGWYDRYAVFARNAVDLSTVENESLRELWSTSPYELLDRTTDVVLDTDEPHPEFSWFEGYAWLPILCPRCGAHCGFEFFPDAGRDSSYWSGEDWPPNGAPPPGEAFFALTGIDAVWGGRHDDEGSRCLATFLLGGDTAVDRPPFRREALAAWARMYHTPHTRSHVERARR
jgi:hypothetical protein